LNPAERLFLERYVNAPGRNLLRYSFVFMIAGIILSVGILSAALNLFEGYERALRSVLLDSFPDIRVQKAQGGYLDAQDIQNALGSLKHRKEISSAIPKLSYSLMAHDGSKVRGALIEAYQPALIKEAVFSKYVIEGVKTPSPGGAIIGHYLAKELNLKPGDDLHVTYPRLDQITPLGMGSNDYSLKISGIYSSGYYEYDRSLIICDLSDASAILGVSDVFSSIEIRLNEGYQESAAGMSVTYDKLLGEDLSAAPVANTTLLSIVRMQKWLIFIIFSFLVLIAGINVISGVSTLIFDKQNEIAVLKAIGASSRIIKNILGHQLEIVCLGSIIIGQAFGFLLSWLVVKQNFYHLKGDVYFIDRLELFVSPLNLAVTFAVAATLVILCIRIPLRKVDRMFVIDLLRNT
jgi:lipoprotein-releasing system permease protein